jgi:hypothetical protein
MKIHSPGFTRRGGNRHMCWEPVRHHRHVGSGSFHFQSHRVMTCTPRYQLVCRMWYAWRNACVSICWSPGTPVWELRSTACKVQRPTKWICVEWQVECNIVSLDPEDHSRCGGWPNWWWMFLLRLLPWSPMGANTLSYSEKAESLAESLEDQCQLLTVPSFLSFIGMCDVALLPTSRPQQANPS